MRHILSTAFIVLFASFASAQQLRFDMIPQNMLGPDGKYQPLRHPPMKVKTDVPRDQVICFCLYTTANGTLKLTAQLYPLKEGESDTVALHIEKDGQWQKVAQEKVVMPGTSAHFRVKNWDMTRDHKYRVTHPGGASYEGIIRRDPVDKETIVVAHFTGNSSTDRNLRPDIVANIKAIDPDLLFFSGDQSYDHKHHIQAWLLFGQQFGEIIKDRPTVTIPDDHDVGQPNIWGEAGVVSKIPGNADGGYSEPIEYVNMVQRQQTWHLPDPVDPAPIRRGITVYFTDLNVGGIDCAIIEDRKFKTGPAGIIPQMGPRPDHINDPNYDRQAVDVPEAELLGDRQLKFLRDWGQDWDGAVFKVVLSQSPLAGAAHLHGAKRERLLADLDSNGWPQHGRNAALREIRKAFALHLNGDQHLSTVIRQGVNAWGDACWSFAAPAIWNLYGRSWVPENPHGRRYPADSPLEYSGNYYDGFGNKLTMVAYANPSPENFEGTGFGVTRFNKKTRQITMECWPRFVDVTKPGATQYPGWPITINQEDNYGREAIAWLPKLVVSGAALDPVVQIVDEFSGEVTYTLRIKGSQWSPKVFRDGAYTIRVKAGDQVREFKNVESTPEKDARTLEVKF